MSNNNDNKKPLDLTDSLPVFDKPGEKNYTLDIPEINQPDVTTRNLSHSDELTIDFLLDCATTGHNRANQAPSICKVSSILRDLSVRSFIPQLVSIGPIHRENKKLKEFEWLKGCYLDDLLSRCDSEPKETLQKCLQKVSDLIPKIRESYDGMIKDYSDDELARMMVMDGCFILEFCFKHEEEDLYLPNKMQNFRIAMDLILLENQVPFFVLQALFDCSMGGVSFTLSKVLDKYLAPYTVVFRPLLPEKIATTNVDSDSTYDHVLGYLHKRYQLVEEKRTEGTAFHSVVELDRSGMKFVPHGEDIWSMTIKFKLSHWFLVFCYCCCCRLFTCLLWFWIKPTLLMPTLVIDDFTELILRNFLAYEHSFPQDRYYFTSYAHAMRMLIDTQEEIAKLVESKVLVNILGSNQEAADMINKICKNISITDFYYTQEFKQVDMYYNGFWPTKRRIYFSNPWNAINLLVGIIVFLATVGSAIFAILEYFR